MIYGVFIADLLVGAKHRLEIAFNPGPVENQVYQHQDNKYSGQIEMDVATFVPGHRPKCPDFISSLASCYFSAASAGAGRQDVLDYETGSNQPQEADKTYEIYNKINGYSFHIKIAYEL